MQKILIVTYGGGHVRMLLPVIRGLQNNYELQIIALTAAGPILDQENIAYKGFKDFIDDDQEALQYGAELAKDMHNSESKIDQAETIAYLGLSFQELVASSGSKERALELMAKEGRQCFLPKNTLLKIIKKFQPDLVITTNSPRAEKAAIFAAQELGVKSMTLVDLLGVHEAYKLCADYICVFSSVTKNNLIKGGIPAENIYITGNPVFDEIKNYQKIDSSKWRQENLGIAKEQKILLWTDQHALLSKEKEVFLRSDADIINYLDMLYLACEKHNILLLIRPHPSQKSQLYSDWIASKNSSNIRLAREYNIYEIINASDMVAGFTSTSLLQALLMGKIILQFTSNQAINDLDITECPNVYAIKNQHDLHDVLTLSNQKLQSHNISNSDATEKILSLIQQKI